MNCIDLNIDPMCSVCNLSPASKLGVGVVCWIEYFAAFGKPNKQDIFDIFRRFPKHRFYIKVFIDNYYLEHKEFINKMLPLL